MIFLPNKKLSDLDDTIHSKIVFLPSLQIVRILSRFEDFSKAAKTQNLFLKSIIEQNRVSGRFDKVKRNHQINLT